MEPYDHKKIEEKWRKIWERKKPYAAKTPSGAAAKKSKKFYALIEFPYPSGDGLHVGHIRSNAAMDIIARKRRAEGYNVLYPIGWDAFGLPTENYAIKTGIQPKIVTRQNTDNFRRQLKVLGFSFDWDREVNTTDPNYYKWTQWIFLELYKRGLAYKKKMAINWCPKDKIGLANEEVMDGKCERCGTLVEKREKEQWMLAITKYADRLDKDLDSVDFLEKIKIQQRNWIGRSEGAEIEFRIKNHELGIKIFTTRPDTLFGVTYLVLAPENQIITNLKTEIENWAEILRYIEVSRKKTEVERTAEGKEKTGVELKGVRATNPANGEEIPVWIADYVLADYGTGAIMAVPAHDERDFEFARKFKLPIREVIAMETGLKRSDEERRDGGCAVVFDPATQKYAVGKDENGFIRFFSGGIDSKEDIESGVLREVVEESGLHNFSHKEKIGNAFAHFYNTLKKVNRLAFVTCYLVILKDTHRVETKLEAHEKFSLVWLSADEILENWKLNNRERDVDHWMRFLKQSVSRAIEAGYDKTSDPAAFNHSAWTGGGILVNSGKFDGLSSETAGKPITESVGGKIVTTYKLRDWVFSRQRYWGEPIPMVYCESCATQKQKGLIIHGFEGHADNNWFPWMKSELEKRGFEVRVPTMTKAAHPDVSSWLKELKPLVKDFGPHDIIIGHSLGSKAALHLLEKSKKKIGSLFLIASAIGQLENRDWEALAKRWPDSDISSLKKFWHQKINLEKASTYAARTTIVLSDDDTIVDAKTHQDIPKSWDYRIWTGHKHFHAKQIPELLDLFLSAKNTGWVPVPEKDLPIVLPEVKNYKPTDTGESPLAAISNWVETKCPACKGKARRETDTMPNWAGSSWYYLRYLDPKNKKEFVSKKALDYWCDTHNSQQLQAKGYQLKAAPVDWYNGGMEHTTLHLLYSRFWHKFLYDLGHVPTAEPYAKRTSHGLILAEGGEKMSKSRGNVINPDELVTRFGADTLRLYEMFMGPFDQAIVWNTESMVGVRRFIERVWRLRFKIEGASAKEKTEQISGMASRTSVESNLESLLHQTIKKVSEDIEALRFNTAISQMMILVNALEKQGAVSRKHYQTTLRLVAPFAPFFTEELWHSMGNKASIHSEKWPVHDSSKLVQSTLRIVIQVNGKVRSFLDVGRDTTESEIKAAALELEDVKKWINDTPVKRVIFVPGKLLNVVT